MNKEQLAQLHREAEVKRATPIARTELEATSKAFPFFGYVEVCIQGCPAFLMFSNNDDFVAKTYYWLGPNSYEGMTLKLWLILSRTCQTVFDIGSYTGLFSLAAASANNKTKVIAFEALDRNYLRFINNKLVNGLGNISIINKAASNSNSDLEFNIYSGDDILVTGSSLIEKKNRSLFAKRSVKATTLDIFCAENNITSVGLMKIDAEGAEHLVIEGCQDLLRNNKPDIILEVLEGSELSYLNNIFQSLGYRFYGINDDKQSLVQLPLLRVSRSMSELNTLITLKSTADLRSLGLSVN